MLHLLELFGGIGAPRKALIKLGVLLKSVDYVEIMPYAVSAYNRLFNNDYTPQDVLQWKLIVDLLIHGSPCQDWSNNGLNDENTGRSILYERTLQILKDELNPRPRVVIWENVIGLISKRHIHHFNHYLQTMEELGYSNSFQVLNALDYGLPQHRERVFTVSYLGYKHFEFPKPVKLQTRLIDYLEEDVNEPGLELTENEKSLFFKKDGKLFIHTNNKTGFEEVKNGDSIDVERPKSKTRRGRVGHQIVKTITTSPTKAVYINGKLRKLTKKEKFRLMGYSDVDFEAVQQAEIPDVNMETLIGNTIAVDVLEALLDEVIKQFLSDTVDQQQLCFV